ncbi:ATP-binding protein [Paenibacillus sp. UNC451MF]|uniref:ATP-binding protein n=1 Tax=Paenibacillus sp. UNC451MF TaxID=1449063 RepID=UPI00048FF495|nr:ATP-binding protein [Paenibacillus sp. UNC451MF]
MSHLLLNVLIIWACIFLYQVLWLDRLNHNIKLDKPVLTGVLAIGLTGCMSFQICSFQEYLFDLRGVLLIIGSLYGGIFVGLILSVFTILVRVLQGGAELWSMVIIVMLGWMFISYFGRKYRLLPMKKKLLAGTLLAGCVGELIIVLIYLLRPEYSHWSFRMVCHMLIFGLLHAVCAYMSIYFIEKMNENSIMKAEIQQKEKMQMLGELAASVAHEIRNPMTVVRGFMQLMNTHSTALKRFNDYAPLIIEELDRVESILSDYLSFAKPHDSAWEKLNLSEQMSQAVELVKPYANMHHVEIQTCWQTALTIYFDRKKLRQLIVNLIKNGIEAMPDGGKLHLELYREDDHAIIRILDEGIGMSEEELKRLGSLFYSTKTKGTGIGIMICYKIIETANGTLQLQSEKGKGTTVTIRLPLSVQERMGKKT